MQTCSLDGRLEAILAGVLLVEARVDWEGERRDELHALSVMAGKEG
jgi:hypothetical protein